MVLGVKEIDARANKQAVVAKVAPPPPRAPAAAAAPVAPAAAAPAPALAQAAPWQPQGAVMEPAAAPAAWQPQGAVMEPAAAAAGPESRAGGAQAPSAPPPTPEELQQQAAQVLRQQQQAIVSGWDAAPREEHGAMARELGRLQVLGQNLGNPDVVDNAQAFILNAGEGVFGLGSVVGGAIDWVSQMLSGNGHRFSAGDMIEFRRGQADGAREANPIAALTGYVGGAVLGAVGPGGLAVSGARAIAPAAVTRVLTPVAGQVSQNIGRYMAAGAAFGGAQAAGEGTNIGKGLAAGAIGGPLARGATVAIGAGVRRVAMPTAAALRRVASTIRRPGESMAAAARRTREAAAEFRSVHGRNPGVNEIVDELDAPRLQTSTQMSERSARRARELTRQQMEAAPTELSARGAGRVTGERAATPEPTVARVQDRTFDRFMASNARRQVPISDDTAHSVMSDATFRRAVHDGDEIATRVHRALMHRRPGAAISLRTLEDARTFTGPAVAHTLRDAGVRAYAPYDRALNQFGRLGDIRKGIGVGQQVTAEGDAAIPASAAVNANNPTRVGMRLGAISEVRGILNAIPGKSAASVRRIATDPGLQQRLATILGPDEARAMVEAAKIADRAMRGRLSSLGVQAMDNVADMVNTALGAGVLTAGKGGGAFSVHVLMNIMRRLSLSHGAQKRLVELAYNPDKFIDVLVFLERNGVTPDSFRDFVNAALRSGGTQAAVGGQLAGPEADTVLSATALAGVQAGKLAIGAVRGVGRMFGGE